MRCGSSPCPPGSFGSHRTMNTVRSAAWSSSSASSGGGSRRRPCGTVAFVAPAHLLRGRRDAVIQPVRTLRRVDLEVVRFHGADATGLVGVGSAAWASCPNGPRSEGP